MDSTHATRKELLQFKELGFFARASVFSEAELDALREAAERAHRRVLDAARADDAPPVERIDNQRYQTLLGATVKWEWRDDVPAARSIEPCHHLDPGLAAAVDDPRLFGPCGDVLGCERLSLFSDKLNVKRPNGAPFPWHQESPYWVYGAERADQVVSVLTYLDDANKENGCLWVVPGSHKLGPLPGLKDRGTLGALYTDLSQVPGSPQPVELPAGSVLTFHGDLVHGSQGNRSRQSRRVLVLAYQPEGRRRWRVAKVRNVGDARP